MSENKEINLIRVELETNLQPIAKYKHNKDFIYWGEYNNYPNYLIELYKRDAVHGAIIRGKKDAVFGKGLTYNKETLTVIQQAKIQQFLQGGNPNETWNDLFRKICFNYEVFDGFALQIIWKIGGMSFDVYVMQIGKLRKSVDGKKIYYCEKWINDDGSINSAPHRHPSFTCFDIFNPNIRTGTQIYFFKDDNLNVSEYGNLYPEPNYAQCIQDIETNIEITNHSYNTLKNGMSASSVVTLFNGEPDRPEKKKIAEMFRNTHTGSNNAGRFILNFVNKDGKPAEVTTLTA